MNNKFPHIPIGTPIRFKTQKIGTAEAEIDGIVDEVLLNWALSACGTDGNFYLVLDTDFIEQYQVH